MLVNRERNYTFEEIRDKYLYIVYRIHERYNLDEDALADLVIAYCECIQKNLGRTDFYWSGRLQNHVDQCAKRMLQKQECTQASPECVSYDTVSEIVCYDLWGDEYQYQAQLRAVIEEVLETLTTRESQVLHMLFFEGESQSACGEYFHVCRERIRKIEAKALRKLRHPSRSKCLKSFLR